MYSLYLDFFHFLANKNSPLVLTEIQRTFAIKQRIVSVWTPLRASEDRLRIAAGLKRKEISGKPLTACATLPILAFAGSINHDFSSASSRNAAPECFKGES